MYVEHRIARWREEEKDVPRASRKRATLLSWSLGNVGSVSAAASESPLRIAVWYSTTLRESA